MILIIILYAFLASTFAIGKAALSFISPFFLVAIRMILAGLILLGFHTIVQKRQIRVFKRDLLVLLLLTFFHIYLAYMAEFWALQSISSARAALFYNFSPFFTALIAYFFINERLNLFQWIGMILGFIGLLPLFLPSVQNSIWSILFLDFSELVMLISVVSAVIGWILFKKLATTYSPILINGIAMLLGGFLSLITSTITESSWWIMPVGYTKAQAIGMASVSIVLLIIIANLIFYNLYGFLLKRYSATFLAFAGFMTPLFTALFGWIINNECIDTYFIWSFLLVSVGLALFYWQELKNNK